MHNSWCYYQLTSEGTLFKWDEQLFNEHIWNLKIEDIDFTLFASSAFIKIGMHLNF